MPRNPRPLVVTVALVVAAASGACTAGSEGDSDTAATTEPSTTPSSIGGGSTTAATTGTTTGTATTTAAPPTSRSCEVPDDNYWRAEVTSLPVHPESATWMRTIGLDSNLHPDFGSGSWEGVPIGIPYNVVPADQPTTQIDWTWYADDDMAPDDEPWPMPDRPAIEGGVVAEDEEPDSDAHVLIVQEGSCRLYETWYSHRIGGRWTSPGGAVFDLTSNALPPDGPTSADAAGLPIYVPLVKAAEASAGAIDHALRFTASTTRAAHMWPARHDASDSQDPAHPPMGIRIRLSAGVDPDRFTGQARAIVVALQTYGAVLADNGSDLFISGTHDPAWDDENLSTLKDLRGRDFEVVDTSPLMVDPDSAQVRGP